MPRDPAESLVGQIARLRGLVAQHKRALSFHRERLRQAATELARVEAAARAQGFGIEMVPSPPDTQA